MGEGVTSTFSTDETFTVARYFDKICVNCNMFIGIANLSKANILYDTTKLLELFGRAPEAFIFARSTGVENPETEVGASIDLGVPIIMTPNEAFVIQITS